MPTFQAAGRAGITKKFVAVVSPGTTITLPVPAKSFILMPSGGTVTFKFKASDADADAFPLADGQAIQFDLSLPYPVASNVCTLGVVIGTNVDVYVAAAY